MVVGTGTPQGTARPRYRRAITLFKIVESGTPWYGSIQLGSTLGSRYLGLIPLGPNWT